ncbi:hypothetical protein EB72_16085 [Mycobacterium sp. SWH-M1]|nr:hypothetical protein EB72_16085 [Mycobacterium sp. SWH-M1]
MNSIARIVAAPLLAAGILGGALGLAGTAAAAPTLTAPSTAPNVHTTNTYTPESAAYQHHHRHAHRAS